MSRLKLVSCLASALIGLGLAGADSGALHLRALPLDAKGVVGDLAPGDWKVMVGGKDVKVVAQRTPAQLGQEGQKWVFVLLPVRGPEFRLLAVQSIATFLATLPPSDAVLVVARTAKGMECLTPGFTIRPSLWVKALDTALTVLPGKLTGSVESTFTLPSAGVEKPEEMAPLQAFLKTLPDRKLEKRGEDVISGRTSVIQAYSVDGLGSSAKTVTLTMDAVDKVLESLVPVAGEKHVVVFSRNEIDDLSNPVWAQKVSTMRSGGLGVESKMNIVPGRDVQNTKLQTEMMIRDVTLARVAMKNVAAKVGVTVHSVGGVGETYTGGFGEVALGSGGSNFRMENELPNRLAQNLNLWATRYDLTVDLPAEASRPAKIQVETTRKGIKLFAPTLQ